MNYIFLDLEYNQDFPVARNKKKPRFEIIQIGAVKTDENLQALGTFNSFISPQLYKKMHPYVQNITGIKIEHLLDAPVFSDVYKQFADFCGEAFVLFLWGKDDMPILYSNVSHYHLLNDRLPKKYVNVQKHTIEYLKADTINIGLKKAIEALGVETDYDFHNALNDAMYTYKIYKIVKPEFLEFISYSIKS